MKKLHILALGLTLTALLLSGCSETVNTPTAPGLTAQYAPSQVGIRPDGTVDVLIGFSGRMPSRAIAAAGGAVRHQYRNFPIVFASIPAVAMSRLESNPNILYVERDTEKFYSAQTLDWGVDRVDAEYVHNNSAVDGSGINVGVLDSGGDKDHPDITWAGGYSATSKDPNKWDDKNGHGTHVAGIISANNNDIGVVGVAPNCNIYAVQVGGRRLLISNIIEGIDWVIATHNDSDPNNDITVINMSFGGGASSGEEVALQAAYNTGILAFAAAGNSGSSVDYPAAYNTVMAISSSTTADAISGFSNFGPEIEVIAPGSGIYSTYKGGGYATLSGTSMSSPMAAGVAVLAWSANPSLTRDQIRSLLKSSAEDIGLSASQQGSGLVDAENAALSTTAGNNLGSGGGGGGGDGGGDDGGGGTGADTMHVAAIDFSNKRNLNIVVTIHDEAHANPVSSARVEMTLSYGSSSWNFAGNTDSSGEIKFMLIGGGISGASFTATVTNVTKTDTFYNSASNDVTSTNYTVP